MRVALEKSSQLAGVQGEHRRRRALDGLEAEQGIRIDDGRG
jgi:hypothetical protein